MTHQPLIFLDVETTGLGSKKGGRITDIGAIRVENMQVVSIFNTLIDPGTQLPSFITRLTGITDEMLWKAPKFSGIAAELETFLDGGLLMAHHVDFDYGFLQEEFKIIGISFSMDRCCTAKLSRKLHPELKRHSLDSIIERLELDVANRHRGFDDADVLWRFFQNEAFNDPNKVWRSVISLRTDCRKPKIEKVTITLL